MIKQDREEPPDYDVIGNRDKVQFRIGLHDR